MRTDLTARQRQFLEYIESFIADRGYPPSIREIQNSFGLKSTKGVKDHIDRLVERGYLLREDGAARALALSSSVNRTVRYPFAAPIIGRVAAGLPILAEANEEGALPVPEEFRNIDGLFWLKVRGDSMTGDGINSGDLVLVKPAQFVPQGTLSVIMVENEATVKRFYKYGETVQLVPSNEEYSVMEYFGKQLAEIRIIGKVIALFRYF
ncbi:repressor LexA [Candidatus Fermentibacteria bacterium]|nr:MAG: repressor LexA [Candidatus Fermentibacteria bacterium]